MLPLLLESYKSVGSRAVINIPGKLSLANHFQAVVLETEALNPYPHSHIWPQSLMIPCQGAFKDSKNLSCSMCTDILALPRSLSPEESHTKSSDEPETPFSHQAR
jgi:hypothetical protein